MAKRIAGWALVGAGLLALLLGYIGVSGESLVAKQLPYLVSGGLVGIALVFLGAVLLGLHDLAGLSRRVEAVERQVGDLHRVLLEAADEVAPVDEGTSNGMVTVLAGGHTFHRPDCTVVNGKERARTMSAVEATTEGLAPCKLCQA